MGNLEYQPTIACLWVDAILGYFALKIAYRDYKFEKEFGDSNASFGKSLKKILFEDMKT